MPQVAPSEREMSTWRHFFLTSWLENRRNRLELCSSGQHDQQCKQVWLRWDHVINSLIPLIKESGGQTRMCVLSSQPCFKRCVRKYFHWTHKDRKRHVCSKWTWLFCIPLEALSADTTLAFCFQCGRIQQHAIWCYTIFCDLSDSVT